jgi:protein-S-isoprenylcysteine O-methyltransferase Ste14
MKRILNSNAYGMKSLLVIGFFLIVLPALFLTGSAFLGLPNSQAQVFLDLAKISAAAGVILLAVFIALLVIEHAQDKILFHQYLKNRSKKQLVAEGLYECQFCGCRKVHEFDTICPVCGKKLE